MFSFMLMVITRSVLVQENLKSGEASSQQASRLVLKGFGALLAGSWVVIRWGCKSPNMGYKYSYPTYNPIYNYP